MSALPPYCATADEPIAALHGGDRYEGPDLNAVMPIEQMLDILGKLDNDTDYVAVWVHLAKTVGCDVLLDFDRDGSRGLRVWTPCDSQMRHRSRYMHLLFADLDRVDGRAGDLERYLEERGLCSDSRRSNPRETTKALRGFLRTGGRLLLTPAGRVSIGGGVQPALIDGTDEVAEACRQATLTFLDIRKRFRADPQLRRALRMLGTRTSNGWIVLEAAA